MKSINSWNAIGFMEIVNSIAKAQGKKKESEALASLSTASVCANSVYFVHQGKEGKI